MGSPRAVFGAPGAPGQRLLVAVMGSEGVLGKHVFWGLRPARRWCAGFCSPGIVSRIIDRLD